MSKWDQRLPIGASLRKLASLLTARDKRNAVILFLFMLAGAALEIVGLAAVPAFVSVVISPERLAEVPIAGAVLSQFSDRAGDTLIFWGALVLVVIFGLKNAFLILNYHLQLKYVNNRRTEMSNRLMRMYLNAPYQFHLTRNTSELLRNVNGEVNAICNTVISTLLELCMRMVILLAVLGFLFLVEPLITLAWMVLLGGAALIGVKVISTRLHRYGLQQQRARKRFVQAVYQAFGGIKEIRVIGREDYFAKVANAELLTTTDSNRKKLLISKSIPPISELVAITGLLALACGLVLFDRALDSVLMTLSVFVVGLVRLREVSSAVMSQYANLRYSLVAIEPVYQDLKRLQPYERAKEITRHKVPVRNEIALRDVWFRYDGANDYALKGVTISAKAGTAIGIVGPTGAGKSTVVDVLLGLLQPERGGVFVDGQEIASLGLANWRANAGYVPQNIYLLDDTVRRNIALGLKDSEIDEERVREAVQLAQLDQFVDRQPYGLDTTVGESGIRISGGERQRIGIARALYNRPDLVIFDEATSALDNATESAIMEAMERLRGDRTIVMIAHRLSTVRSCDALFFLRDGQVEAKGSYESLQHSHEGFRRMAAGVA